MKTETQKTEDGSSLDVAAGSLPPLPPSAHASKVYDGYTGRSYWEVWLLGKNVRKLSASLSLSEARTKARQRLAAEAEENTKTCHGPEAKP